MFINNKICVGCGVCQTVCPVDCIMEVNQKLFIKQTECIECEMCKAECPTQAITDIPE